MRLSAWSPQLALAKYVQPGPSASCWPWLGAADQKGYGVVTIKRRQYKAHRLAYELAKGPIPDGLIVRHACDNPPCVNPQHLLTGTHADNARDKAERGRSMFGERASTARLTAEDVLEIRARAASGETGAALARDYGVSDSAIRHVLAGRCWKHLLPSVGAA